MARHHINSTEFENWLADFDDEYATDDPEVREGLYDHWVQGFSAWEVMAIWG